MAFSSRSSFSALLSPFPSHPQLSAGLLQSSSPFASDLQVFPSTSVPAFINPPPPPPSPDSSPLGSACAGARFRQREDSRGRGRHRRLHLRRLRPPLLRFYRYTEKKRRMPGAPRTTAPMALAMLDELFRIGSRSEGQGVIVV
ncbi:hypothetical protein AXF42_Ash017379 [Apostasia shenzhenica]|uniref:Uncharacterized protein n=1 Tax=Apostasia shenzhenica TaxID=1088818 RepID=A0A2I0BDI9_9ASPA|nr:hypothetical protein AXF42_Ash017379 [Apostasia shenzhenica]